MTFRRMSSTTFLVVTTSPGIAYPSKEGPLGILLGVQTSTNSIFTPISGTGQTISPAICSRIIANEGTNQ